MVEHRDGTTSRKLASMKKGIYSLSVLREMVENANQRYIEFISAIDDTSVGVNNLNKISRTVVRDNKSYK